MFIAQLLAVVLALLLPAPQQGDDDDGTTLTAMSFNLRYGTANDGDNSWPNRDHLVMGVFKARNADIVGVQEALAFQLDEITAANPHYSIIGVGRDDAKTKGEYSAILYRADRFIVDRSDTFWLSDTPEVVASTSWGNSIPRICTWARLIDRDSGKAFYIFNAHLDHRSQESREQSTKLIAQRITDRAHDDPVILMGDLNAGEHNPAITYLYADPSGPQLLHTYRTLHPDETAVGTFNSFKGETTGEMIDHIFTTPGTKILEADIDSTNDNGQYPSDHFPIWTRIALPH